MMIPDDLLYTESHEWIKREGENIRVGITDHAQSELTDVVYVELPKLERQVNAKGTDRGCRISESGKRHLRTGERHRCRGEQGSRSRPGLDQSRTVRARVDIRSQDRESRRPQKSEKRRRLQKADRLKPKFFRTPADFRAWLEKNHATATELWVGFYTKDSGNPSITWPESVDQALCFGWIDGIRKRVDEVSYQIRFTPRRRGSIWSAINIKRAEELVRQTQMRPIGLKAFAARIENKSGIYSYEQRSTELSEPYATLLKKNKAAWNFFGNTAAVVSKNDRLVDYQREERRNANGSSGKIDQRVCERKTPAPIAISLLKRSPAVTDPTRC